MVLLGKFAPLLLNTCRVLEAALKHLNPQASGQNASVNDRILENIENTVNIYWLKPPQFVVSGGEGFKKAKL